MLVAELTENEINEIKKIIEVKEATIEIATNELEVAWKYQNMYKKLMNKVDRKVINEEIVKLIKKYSIEFLKCNEELPCYYTLETDSEYDDEGGTYEYISCVHFASKKGNYLELEFEIEDGEIFGEAVVETIQENGINTELLEEFNMLGEKIEIQY